MPNLMLEGKKKKKFLYRVNPRFKKLPTSKELAYIFAREIFRLQVLTKVIVS